MKTAILMSMVALLCAACAAPPTQVVLLPQPVQLVQLVQ